jgi:hypothetical protein
MSAEFGSIKASASDLCVARAQTQICHSMRHRRRRVAVSRQYLDGITTEISDPRKVTDIDRPSRLCEFIFIRPAKILRCIIIERTRFAALDSSAESIVFPRHRDAGRRAFVTSHRTNTRQTCDGVGSVFFTTAAEGPWCGFLVDQ